MENQKHWYETFRCIPGGRVLLYKYHCYFRRKYGSCDANCKYIPKGLKQKKEKKERK